MKFCLILCTLGRSSDFENFLKCLISQTYQNYEVIIIDQNKDDRIPLILDNEAFHVLSNRIRYFKVSFTGLSSARNFAFKTNFLRLQILCFPRR